MFETFGVTIKLYLPVSLKNSLYEQISKWSGNPETPEHDTMPSKERRATLKKRRGVLSPNLYLLLDETQQSENVQESHCLIKRVWLN